MPLARDLSDLPKAAIDGHGGREPDAEPRFAHLLASAWQAQDAEDQAARDNGGRKSAAFWFSDAGKCARAISYKAAGIPRSDPMDLSGTWNVNLGSILHDAWQQALVAQYPDAEVEVRVGIDGLDASGYGDAVVRSEDRIIALELKSIGGFGYKAAIGKMSRNRPAEGPKFEHVAQGALLGKAVNADEVVIVYLAKECLSANVASGMPEWARFCAEWTYTRDEYEPLADAEIERVTGILRLVEDGQLAARKVPDPELPRGAEIVDPASSRWEIRDDEGNVRDIGALWNGSYCSYCGWFSLCAKTKSGRISLGDLSEVVVGIAS